MKNLASYIDHTLLAQNATVKMIEKLCDEAKEYSFCSVCVNSSYVKDASGFLKGSDVKICSVVGFPLGAMSTKAKAYEAKVAVEDGADEIDMVINVGWLKSKQFDRVKEDIALLNSTCKDVVFKVILETALLDEEEIRVVCKMSKEIGVDFVKTSTGFSIRGASIEDIEIMKDVVGKSIEIKASGGIRDYEKAMSMVEAGATRLGVSAGIAIVSGAKNKGEGY
ncbi:MAG TPA: deoxyribose-phosphate aldolase [Sulfurospirillum arcachonense]|nr:deoxyribose-phosphate aldolase [Sulfurospirillum arcachonense]HIP45404.1 deoxyribose-phosphate aldolase [Sulfurospirillum arcachonense]